MLLAFEGAGLLDLSGPAEVFACADAILGGDAYRVVMASHDGDDHVSSAGFRIGVAARAADVPGPIDTLVVPGTWTWTDTIRDEPLMGALAATAARSRRVAGVCVGGFLMGAAGLLDGRRATTHWEFLDAMEARFPEVTVERDAIFVSDDAVHTSAGGAAGIDLALSLVEDDHEAGVASRIARHLVVFMQRPGGQSQLSVRLRVGPVTRAPLRELLDAIAADPAGDHSLPALAARARFSERHLARLFARDLGTTPARYVERVRVEAACALLASGDAPLASVAREAGFGSAETMRRSFARAVGTTPQDYRRGALGITTTLTATAAGGGSR